MHSIQHLYLVSCLAIYELSVIFVKKSSLRNTVHTDRGDSVKKLAVTGLLPGFVPNQFCFSALRLLVVEHQREDPSCKH